MDDTEQKSDFTIGGKPVELTFSHGQLHIRVSDERPLPPAALAKAQKPDLAAKAVLSLIGSSIADEIKQNVHRDSMRANSLVIIPEYVSNFSDPKKADTHFADLEMRLKKLAEAYPTQESLGDLSQYKSSQFRG